MERCRRRLRALYGRRMTWLPASRAPERWLEVNGYRAGRSATADVTGRRHRETLKLLSELLLMGRPTDSDGKRLQRSAGEAVVPPAADAVPLELGPAPA